MTYMTFKNTLFSLILMLGVGIAALGTYYCLPGNPILPLAAPAPDSYMEDVQAVVMNKQGKPHLKIDTPKMVHYSQNDLTTLSDPRLTIYRNSPQPWYISAKYARATDGINHVNFWDNVVIQHAADIASPATTIKTTTLTVFPNEKKAETNDPITLLQPDIVVNAKGMFADMNTGDIKLLSEARGEYVPSS